MKNMFLSRKEKKKEEAAPQGGGISRALGKVSFEGFDWWLFTLMLIILAIGLIMVLSASGIVAEQVNGDKYYFFKRQLIFACGGGLVLWGAALMPRSWLYKLQYPAIFLSLFLLLLTLSPLTPSINGAKRWIPLGPVNLQPMEFVKISLALYLAYFMSSKQALVKTFSRGVIPPFAVTGLFCGLLLLQPDFGSAVVVASILFFMCLAGGTRFIYLFFAMILACAGAMGVGASRQKMFYLPEAHNDFIMAVLAEELGFVGITVVMLMFGLLFWRCYRIIMRQTELRDRLTAFGLTVILAMGAVMNLAVVMGVAPPKGVPMPLMSYGGSNLMATMLCVGLLMNFSRTATGKEGSIWKESS